MQIDGKGSRVLNIIMTIVCTHARARARLFSLKDEQQLKVSEKQCRGEYLKLPYEFRTFHNQGIHNSHSLPLLSDQIKGMKWTGLVARMGSTSKNCIQYFCRKT
jgi:hypothetical protein